jgi:hypothetical protein
LVGLN